MATTKSKPVILPADILYLLTFALGMAAFWISGHAAALLPVIKTRNLAMVASLAVTSGVYGFGMLILATILTRRFSKGTVIATILSIILGLVSAQVIVRLAASHVHTTTGVGLLTFALYMCYGTIYVVSLAAGRRFAK